MYNLSDGFTLIELLIVTAVIGILVAILIPNLLQARNKANDSAAITYLRQCVTSMESVRDSVTGKFSVSPTTCQDSALAEAKLSLSATVKSSKINIIDGENYTITVESSTGNKFTHDGYRIVRSN